MISTEEAQKQLNAKISSNTIVFAEPYKGDKVKHQFRCVQCNHYWESTPNTLKRANNKGCPKCYIQKQREISVKKTEKTAIDKSLPGAKKLREGITKPMPARKSNSEVVSLRKKIALLDEEHRDLSAKLPLYKSDFENKSQLYQQVKTGDWEFGLFALILLPLWILVAISQSRKNQPYYYALHEARNKYKATTREIQRAKNESEWHSRDIRHIEEKEKYIINIERLSDRLNIKIGGKTNLYYFRFKHKGRDYYKIGITINSIGRRYRRWDG